MNKSIRSPVYPSMAAFHRGASFLVLFLGLVLGSAQAQTTNSYTGANGAAWETATNWSLGSIPTNSSEVYVTNGVAVRISSAVVASNLFIGGPSGTSTVQLRRNAAYSLNVGGNITMGSGAGSATLQLGVSSGGTSTLTIGDGTGAINDGGGAGATTIEVYGPVTLNLQTVTADNLNISQNTSASMTIATNQTWNVAATRIGELWSNAVCELTVAGTLNSTTINLSPGVVAGTNSGTLNLSSGGLIRATTLQRSGAMPSTFNWNDGTIQNRSGGNLTVQGSANGMLTMSLAGTGTHTFNVDSGRTITVASTATLADKSGEQGTLVKAGAGELIFSGNNSYTGDTTVLGGTLTLNSGQGLSDTGAVTLSNTAGVTLKVNASETIGSLRGGGTAGGNITLAEGQSLTIVQADDQTFGGQITGAGGLVKAGAGKLSLTKNNNSFVGGVTIDGGILTSDYGSISSANTIVVNSGGTLGMLRTDTWAGANATSTIPVIINAGGNMTSDNQFNTFRDLTLNGGNVTLNGGHPAGAFGFGGTLSVNGALPSAITTTTGSNNFIRLGRQTETNSRTTFDVTDPAGQLTVNAILADQFDFPAGLDKSGAGKVVLLGTNSYSGVTTVSGGTLQIGNGGTNGTLGTAATGIAISSGAILSFNRTDNYGGNFTRNLSGAGEIILSSGTLTLANSSNSFTGGLTINGGTLKGLGGAIPAANSVVVNSGGTFGMGTTDTWGTAATTNTVAVTVNSGGNMTTDGQFNSLRNLTLNGGTVSLNGGLASTASALVLGGTVTAGGATTSAIAAVSGSNNAIRLGREGTSESTAFNVTDGAGTLAISAPLTNNFGAISGLIKNGDGKLVLSGILGYTGTNTVNGGSLVISNAAYAATITPNAIRVDYSNPPTVGTNNLLPGPVNASSLASYSVNGNGSTTVTLTNSPNLKAIVTSSAPANQKPVINAGQTFSVAENSAAGTAVGTLTATDADSNPLSGWAIVSGNTGGAFALNSSTGQLTVLGSLNYEGTPSYSLAVTVSDGTATSDPVNIMVNVSNVPEYSDIFGSADPSADSNGDGISNLLAYALGATNSNSVVERPTLSVTTSNLTLTALVRTNDPKVAVWGNATTTLTNWPTNLIVGLPSADQTGAVSGITQKQDFTVERGTNARQFLRLKATLNP